MEFWYQVWNHLAAFFHTWYGAASAFVALLWAIFKAIPLVFTSWDFFLDRFRDRPVLKVLHYVCYPNPLPPWSPNGPGETHPTIIAIAKHGSYSVGDLANILKRSHRSIGKSIERLRMQGKIELYNGGFRLKK
jgi:hypothetical protein